MGIAFVLDEHLRGVLHSAAILHNITGGLPIAVTQVGSPPDLPLGSHDSDILIWAEANQRVLLSFDRRTMIALFHLHLAAGHHSPGVFMLRQSASIPDIIAYLELATHAGEASDFADRITYIP